jgi:predicted MFS family arabinose efflux permease
VSERVSEVDGTGKGYAAALRVPIVRRLVGASTASVVGDYLGVGALLVMAAERTDGSAIGAAGVFASAVPMTVLVGTLAGPLFDRVRRVPSLVTLELLGAALICLPLLVDGVAIVYVTAALLAGQRTATGAIRQGVIADGVSDRHRPALIALGNTVDQGAQVLGYLAGAAIYLAVSPAAALLLDAGSFVIAALLLAGVRLPDRTDLEEEPPSFATGWRIIADRPILLLFGTLTLLTATTGALPETLAPTIAPGDDRLTPALLAAAPLGQAIAIVTLGRTRVVARPWFQLSHLAFLAGALLLASASPGPGWLVVANLVVGAGVAWVLGPQLTFLRLTPPARMAQVAGLMWAGIAAAEGAGSVLFGALADARGPAAAYAAAGGLLVAAAVVGTTLARRSAEVDHLDREVRAEVTAGR